MYLTNFLTTLKVKVKSMKSYDDRVGKLTACVEELANQETKVDELDSLKVDHEKFVSDWNALVKK